MANIDQLTNAYMSDKAHFADIFNYFIYDGKSVICPDTLQERDTTELVLPFKKGEMPERIERFRDILKYACVMEDDQKKAYLLLGIEDQSHVHYAAPVKVCMYDIVRCARQVETIESVHRKDKDHARPDEFLSGFHKDDRILPVITLVIYWSDKEWDGPLELHDMMYGGDESFMKYVVNYRVNLVSPSMINDFGKFRTELGEVLEYIKYSGDKEALDKALKNNADFQKLDRQSAELINMLTGSGLDIPEGEEKIDMCRAIDQMREQAEAIGIEKGNEDAMLSSIRNLMETMDWTAQKAMTALKISLADQDKYVAML